MHLQGNHENSMFLYTFWGCGEWLGCMALALAVATDPKKQENTMFFSHVLLGKSRKLYVFHYFLGVAGVHGPGLGCGHGRALRGAQVMLKSNENTMFFNTFQQKGSENTVFRCFLNSTHNQETCQPELLT